VIASAERPVFIHNLLVFGRTIRRLGLDVHPGRMLDVTEALQHVDVGSRDDVYYTCRTLLVHRHDDLEIFDRAFDAFWLGWRKDLGGLFRASETKKTSEVFSHESTSDRLGALRTWSDTARLATKDFAEFTDEEIALARAAVARLSWHPGERATRRWIRGPGPRLDVRRALRQGVRTGGDVFTLPRRERRRRPRPVVLLCDVSGSMERYSRLLLHFAHALRHRYRRVETLFFATSLTRITSELQPSKLDEAVAAVSRAVPDWSGGTRIGDALEALRHPAMRHVLRGRPVVLLVSDGWDRGDPVVLRDEMARLQRNCHRLIWLNPLIGTAGYAPLTRGLQAALPFVDDFLPARTLVNLSDLAIHLNSLS
jgi:uncharacterized protein with von Willebrand factor type A (vWA) domain